MSVSPTESAPFYRRRPSRPVLIGAGVAVALLVLLLMFEWNWYKGAVRYLAKAQTGRELVISKVPTISELDVVGFQAYPAADGTYGVLFHLNDHGKLALDTLSVERRGSTLIVLVNGRLVGELQIDRRVSDGKLYIAAGLTAQDVELMKKDWRPLNRSRK